MDELSGKDRSRNEWVSFTDHARTASLNLCQGFPDFSGPQYVKEFLSQVALSDDPLVHQYTRSAGNPQLVEAIAKLYSPLVHRDLDPMSEVVVTVGGVGALFVIINGLISPGDEVIIIEPFFAFYSTIVRNVGGVPVYIALKPVGHSSDDVLRSGDFTLDPDELASKFSPKTKMLIFNTPNNPLGKVYSRDEMEVIADLCRRHKIICVADEVYEWLTFDGTVHIRMATLPGMWERTITLGSAGKAFTVTGWKVGWCFGPKELINECASAGRACWGTCPSACQVAIAHSIEKEVSRFGSPDSYFVSLAREMAPKRHVLASILKTVGIRPIIPDGGYFVMCDITGVLGFSRDESEGKQGNRFASWLAETKSIAVMPGEAFYGPEHKSTMGATYARFCFFKKDETLQECARLVEEWKKAES